MESKWISYLELTLKETTQKMKKIMTMTLGLALVFGLSAVASDDKKKDDKKEHKDDHKKKKDH
jgi:hypothetical protein